MIRLIRIWGLGVQPFVGRSFGRTFWFESVVLLCAVDVHGETVATHFCRVCVVLLSAAATPNLNPKSTALKTQWR